MTKQFWRRFRDDETGAVTVDWVVLTAGVLIFGVLVAAMIADGANNMSTGAGAQLASAQVPEVRWD